MVCIESNKKLLAYSLFNQYIPQSSCNYIDYLVHNTKELAEYRAPPSIVQLPVMAAKKQQEKPGKKGQKTNKPTQDLPTNMKPPGRGGPPRPIPIQQEQEPEVKPNIRPPRKGVPMPPNIPQHDEASTTPIKTPPPPPMKKGPSNPQVPEPITQPIEHKPPTQIIPPPPKKNNPPPPPPKTAQTKTQSYE